MSSVQSSSVVRVQRPSRKGVGPQAGSEAHGPLSRGVVIWSGLTGNREWLSEAGSRNTTQNVPRPRKNFDIRKSFIASPGKKLIVADYDQLEMFLLANFSNDKGMLRNIHMGRDIHTANVELVWGEPYDDVARAKKDKKWTGTRPDHLRDLRNQVKVVGFGQQTVEAELKLSSQRGSLKEISLPW